MARFAVQGYRDPEKPLLMHDRATLGHASLRIIMPVGPTFQLGIWSVYINQAYTCSHSTTPEFYVRANPAFSLSPDMLFQIMRHLSDLSHASDAW